MNRKHKQSRKSRKGEGDIDLGCVFLILCLGGCVSCGCGVKIAINEEKK